MGNHIQLEDLIRIKGVNSAVLATRDGFLINYASRVAVDAEGLASVAAICLQTSETEVQFAHSRFLQKPIAGENMTLLVKSGWDSADQLGVDWPFVFLFYLHDQALALVCHRKVELKDMFRQIIKMLDLLGMRSSSFSKSMDLLS